MIIRCKRCASGDTAHRPHGKVSCYAYHGCQETVCRTAMQACQNRHRLRKRGEDIPKLKQGREKQFSDEELHRRALAQSRAYRRAHPSPSGRYDPEYQRAYSERNGGRNQYRRRERDIPSCALINTGQPWTEDDKATAARTDITLVEKCYLLGRSASSIGSMRRRARGKSPVLHSVERGGTPWTPTEDAIVQSMSIRRAAEALHRTPNSVMCRRRKLCQNR